MSDRASAIESTLLKNTPPTEYEKVWAEFADCMGQISDIFAKGSDMDANHDNHYTGDEMTQLIREIKDEFVVVARTSCDLAIELEDISNEVAATEEVATSEDVDSTEHVCAVCGVETQLFYKNPILGVTEYYCKPHQEHMIEIMDSMMEHKVTQPSQSTQNSSSTHTCTECGKSANQTYKNPFSGATEYYCETHYQEIKSIIGMMEDDVKNSSQSNQNTNKNSYSGSSARHTDSEAFSCAKAIVKSSLKSPSTAKFCWITDATVTHLGNGEYKVTGWVDAQNSFGATLRQNFVVVYTATENGYKNGTATLY